VRPSEADPEELRDRDEPEPEELRDRDEPEPEELRDRVESRSAARAEDPRLPVEDPPLRVESADP